MKKLRIDEIAWDAIETVELNDRDVVEEIISGVKNRGDEALREYSLRFDGLDIEEIEVPSGEIDRSSRLVSEGLFDELRRCADSIEKFARKQRRYYRDFDFEIAEGVFTGQRIIPIDRVGVYVPGGRYPLFSSLLMAAIPARVAGVGEVIVCSPPRSNQGTDPALLAAAKIAGVNRLFKAGGAQAVAAMAYGTRTVPRVDKIVGPGNVYVNLAKKYVYGRVGIDFIAGPTEILIIADDSSESNFLAADLIAQAEHDPLARAVLVTNSEKTADEVVHNVGEQLASLRSSHIARASLEENGLIVVVDTLNEAIDFCNRIAPEHVLISVRNSRSFVSRLRNYGSLFVGPYSAVTLGDYSSGLNHTLPTNGAARYTGGLSVGDFLKIQTCLKVEKKGLSEIGPTAEVMAGAEGLEGHARAIQLRRHFP